MGNCTCGPNEAVGKQTACVPSCTVRSSMMVQFEGGESAAQRRGDAVDECNGWWTRKEESMYWRIWPRTRQLPELKQLFADRSHQVGPKFKHKKYAQVGGSSIVEVSSKWGKRHPEARRVRRSTKLSESRSPCLSCGRLPTMYQPISTLSGAVRSWHRLGRIRALKSTSCWYQESEVNRLAPGEITIEPGTLHELSAFPPCGHAIEEGGGHNDAVAQLATIEHWAAFPPILYQYGCTSTRMD